MLRNKTRRSFTVETKHGLKQGRAIINAKAPRTPREGARSAFAAPSTIHSPKLDALAQAEAGKDASPKRILPSLVTWEASAPEPAPALPPEPPLPRVRRVVPLATTDEAPRRRGRPKKVALDHPVALPAVLADTPPAPAPAPVAAPSMRPVRSDRSEAAGLARGERWKRRLPRAIPASLNRRP